MVQEERYLTIGSTARLTPDEVARHTFATSRRGFEPGEVRAFLQLVAREMTNAVEREHELKDMITEAEHRAAHPVLDEATLAAALGDETARVLRSAQDAAAEILQKAEGEAQQLRAKAQDELQQARDKVENALNHRQSAADAAAAKALSDAEEQASAILASGQEQAQALVDRTRQECRSMFEEAQGLRARVLSDLASRRRVLQIQIEQLRAGRERLAETIGAVRDAVDSVTDELFRAEDEARLAAEAAARHKASAVDSDDDVVEIDDHSTSKQQAVDDLFARLRATTETGEEQRVSGSSSGDALITTAELQLGDSDKASPEAKSEENSANVQDDGPSISVRRDEALEPIVGVLSRRIKRALRDDQNEMLASIRAKGWDISKLVPEKQHEQRFFDAVAEQVDEAARAGALFSGAKMDDAPPTYEISQDLVLSIVTPLRSKLVQTASSVSLIDQDDVVEQVAAVYREWKGPKIDALAAHFALAAFSEAILVLAMDSTSLRWIAPGGQESCPDCEDNVLAGPVAKGDAFPTGHHRPPAHLGCRCLICADA